ncbi:MAG TPA: phenylalanine--tRNA ligase subunit beta [Candidatus Saccharimonadales bacterium]|nr:phenylalanine--tRNA ligase subunit beta [Candidatus Saccharimonadales bacterium]
MKVSLNWIRTMNKNYGCSDSAELKDVDKLVERIGEQLGAVEEVISLGERYENIYVVKVVKCAKHPDADKLSVCLIDDGGKVKDVERKGDGLVEVVCGAPNVIAGVTVAWIPPGATVPSTFDKDPFVLEARPLRGVVSNGMLASAKELAIGDSQEGLLLLDDELKAGTTLIEALRLDDHIIDIENKMFTHRPDCFGMLGVARELAGISGKAFKSPDWYKENIRPAEGFGLELAVNNEAPELVPRFTAIAMKGVRVAPSPVWLQAWLARVGVRPINNVVDITNFFMLATGQPLHAYDYDKLKTGTLGVRLSQAGEELPLLNGKTLKLKAGAVVITDGKKPVGLGGVMGGSETEVDENTKNIVLECATFDMNLTRRTAMEYGLFTDAVTRFTKGQSPLQNLAVLTKTIGDMERIGGAQIASRLIDERSATVKTPKPVSLSVGFINDRLGEDLKPAEISKLLENVEFKVEAAGDELKIDVPFWRTDIEIAEDIVEEVGRLYGYDKLPQILPRRDLTPARIDHRLAFKSKLRDIMVSAGANEVLTYSFVDKKLLEAAGQNPDEAYHIKNAVSPELQYYRLNLAPSLLEKVRPNVKNGYEVFVIFEIGKGHVKGSLDDEGLPEELETLAAVIVDPYAKGAPFYAARNLVDYVLDKLNIPDYAYVPIDGQEPLKTSYLNSFETSRTALVSSSGTGLGFVGEPSQKLRQFLKLPAHTSMFELIIPNLYERERPKAYHPLNRFPASTQDICLKLPLSVEFEEADKFVWDNLHKLAGKSGYLYEMETLDIFQREDDKKHQQITWHVSLSHPERTLTTEEVNKLLDELAKTAHDKLDAERI